MDTHAQAEPVTVIGVGLVGSLLSIFLARRGFRVRVFERLPDMRKTAMRAGRSINLAISEPPNFTALPGATVGPQHHGTMHFVPDQDFIERAYDDAKYGIPSRMRISHPSSCTRW